MFPDYINFYSLTALSNGITASVLGLFVLSRNSRGSANRIYALSCLTVAFWSYCWFLYWPNSGDEASALFWFRTLHAGAIFIPICWFHFIVAWLHLYQENRRIVVFGYSLSFVFLGFSFSPLFLRGVVPKLGFSYWGQPGFVYHFFLGTFFCYAVYSCYLLFREYNISSGVRRNQIKYIFAGSLLAYVGGATNYPLFYDIPIRPVGNLLISVYVAMIAYTIVKYRLMDIRIIVKKGLVYGLSTGLIIAGFVAAVLGIERLFREYAGYTTLPLMTAVALIVAFAFYPLKNRIQRVVDKYFYKGAYDYQQVMRDASKAMTSILDLEQLLSYILTVVTDSMKIERGSILLREPKARRFETKLTVAFQAEDRYPAGPQLTWQNVLIGYLRRDDEPIVREEMERILAPDEARVLSREMKSYNADVAIPMMRKDRLMGVILLGPKLSGDIYTGDDLQLLSTLANQSAIAIRNAWLYSRLLKELDTIRGLEREKAKAERLASLGTMAAGIAHEIKNPLVSIKTFAQLLPEKSSDPEFRNVFSDIAIKEIDRIDSLVLGLLSLAKPSPPNFEPTNVNSVLDETLSPMAVQIAEGEIELTKEYQVDVPLVMADSGQLQQVFSNIIMNSIQATPERGRIDVVTTVQKGSGDQNGYVEIRISDTGVGVAQAELDKIFNPFFTTKHEGVGLGLTICHRIIEDHRGKIQLESKEGVGTTFTILLPAAESDRETGDPD